MFRIPGQAGFVAALLALSCLPAGVLAADVDRGPARDLTSRATGLKLVWIRAGAFEMGSSTSEEGHTAQEAQHTVRITQPFYLGVAEVTQQEYESVMETQPGVFSRTGAGADTVHGIDTSRYPVENVTWYDAVEFCNALGAKDGLKPYYGLAEIQRDDQAGGSIKSATVSLLGGTGYRLPTEAEWEYACRAGTTTAYNSGDTPRLLNRAGWYAGTAPSGGSGQITHRICLKSPNDFGLYDMHGNVSEWCQDWYDYNAYERAARNDPAGPPGGSERVVRGGSWNDPAVSCRSAFRGAAAPSTRRPETGFRVARSMPAAPSEKKNAPVPPFRIVIDLKNGETVDVFNNESYDTLQDARERLKGSRLFGRIDSLRIIDGNGDRVD